VELAEKLEKHVLNEVFDIVSADPSPKEATNHRSESTPQGIDRFGASIECLAMESHIVELVDTPARDEQQSSCTFTVRHAASQYIPT